MFSGKFNDAVLKNPPYFSGDSEAFLGKLFSTR
jgi:tRNA1(Val) A37 N6-methylase TrmN6